MTKDNEEMSGHGKKVVGKSIEIYNTTKTMIKYRKVFQKRGRGSYVLFLATWINKLCLCQLSRFYSSLNPDHEYMLQ